MYIYIIYLMVTDDLVTRVTFLLNGCDALKKYGRHGFIFSYNK